MREKGVWATIAVAILVPIISALVCLYSDVQTLKVTKAEMREVMELKVNFTKQMERNTVVIENLDKTLKVIIDRRLHNE